MMFSIAETKKLKEVLENYGNQLQIAMDNANEDKDIIDVCVDQLSKVCDLLTMIDKRS